MFARMPLLFYRSGRRLATVSVCAEDDEVPGYHLVHRQREAEACVEPGVAEGNAEPSPQHAADETVRVDAPTVTTASPATLPW
jgi:hypothetical protein